MIKVDQYHVIRHLYVVERLPQRAIAERLGISRNTVRKYCKGATTPAIRPRRRKNPRKLDQALDRIVSVLKTVDGKFTAKQRLTLPALDKLVNQGDNETISITTLRRAWKEFRRRQEEVFVPLVHRPGDEAQVDFFEVVACVGGQNRKLWMFVMRLVYSGLDFVSFYDHCDRVCLLDGHIRAFEHFGGVPARIVYDNLTPVVKSILLGKRVLQEAFRNFVGHYAFEPCFARPGEGHDKGAIESRGKSIRLKYLTPIPDVESLDALDRLVQEQFDHQLKDELSIQKGCEEIDRLLPLPQAAFECRKLALITLSSKSTFQLDSVTYSLPEHLARLSLNVWVGPRTLEVKTPAGGSTIRLERGLPGERKIQYLHYARQLARKPQALRQVAPELLKELGEPYRKLWRLLEPAHGALATARLFAKLMHVMGDDQHQLSKALEGVMEGLTAPCEAWPSPHQIEVPSRLSGHIVEQRAATDFNALHPELEAA